MEPRSEPAIEPASPAVEPGRVDTEQEDATTGDAELVSWLDILERLAKVRPELSAILQHAAPLEVSPRQVVVGWEPGSVFAEQASDKDSLSVLTRVASEHFKERTHVVFELESQRAKGFDTLAAQNARERQARLKQAVAEAKRHPRVVDAMEVLGARLKELKLANE